MTKSMNADQLELDKFSGLAHQWWDKTGEFKSLHDINPLRLNYISDAVSLNDKRVLDVGCGGGILSESMAAKGASVVGIDLAENALKVARLHSLESKVEVDYRLIAVEALAEEAAASFDVVTCLEMLEHVPDPASVVNACAKLVKPEGHVFFSTINRNPKAYVLAILGAEYILNLLPKGTHDYAKFIKPSELAAWARQVSLFLINQTGIQYNPCTQHYALGDDVAVNYLVHMIKDSAK